MDPRLERLHALRGTFGPVAGRERLRMVRALARVTFRRAAALADWHDELLFLAAFPDSRAVHAAVRRALGRIARQVRALPAAEREALTDSGIAGTETRHTFEFGAARWLAAHDECIAFDWARADDAARLDPLLRLALVPAEGDRFDSGEVSTAAFLDEAAALLTRRVREAPSAAYWLLSAPPRAPLPVLRTLYDEAEPPLRWELGDSPRATTHARLPVPLTLRRRFRPPPHDPIAHAMTPLHGIRRARDAEARRWHAAAVAALLPRTREVFPIIHANPREVLLAPLGEGVTLCLLGAAREDRSALEANYGYVLFANGIAIGYGGVTTFGAQANTGLNVFESFRRSEAAFLFAQALRAFRTLFGVTRFVVNAYQVGGGNPEAIASGAYWFYDRLGFRPRDPATAALATGERDRLAHDRSHRTSARTLRRLATGDLVLTLPDAAGAGRVDEQLLADAGRLATHALATVPAGGRAAWVERHARALRHRCIGRDGPLSHAERLGAWHLVPLIAALRLRLAQWPAAERAALWRLVQLKGGAQERPFARAAARLPRLWRALARAGAGVARSSRRNAKVSVTSSPVHRTARHRG